MIRPRIQPQQAITRLYGCRKGAPAQLIERHAGRAVHDRVDRFTAPDPQRMQRMLFPEGNQGVHRPPAIADQLPDARTLPCLQDRHDQNAGAGTGETSVFKPPFADLREPIDGTAQHAGVFRQTISITRIETVPGTVECVTRGKSAAHVNLARPPTDTESRFFSKRDCRPLQPS